MNRSGLVSASFLQVALRVMWQQATGVLHPEKTLPEHLRAAMAWLALAQDQTGNGGVSAGFGRNGWRADYPETTGYIIPTFLDYYRLSGEPAFRDRAIRMGDYELAVQDSRGAIPGGYAEPRLPEIFDTGQVIFGWVSLFGDTGRQEYRSAAVRAGDWLLSVQAEDGSWPTHEQVGAARTYHSRVSWALVELGLAADEPRFVRAARRQLDWTLAQQQPNGWFAKAELRMKEQPVTHTIAYVTRGLLESGAALNEPTYIDSARKTADALLSLQLADGSLYGVYDSQWSPRARWRCLTGCAQTSIIWLRLYELTGQPKYLAAAQKANRYLRQTQDLDTDGPNRGAIAGSKPFFGSYERFSYPNWATKFLADVLMLEMKLAPAQAQVTS